MTIFLRTSLYYILVKAFYFCEVKLMSVEIRTSGDTLTAYLTGELDHHSAKEMREAVDNAVELNMPSKLVLDFGGVSFMDSSGIGLVMGRYRTLLKTGAQLYITGASPQIYKVMKLAGIERLAKLEEK